MKKNIRESFLGGDDIKRVQDAAVDSIGRSLEEQISPVRTWLPEYDRRTLGFEPGRLYVIAGRPGSGKTSFATTSTANILRHSKQNVLYISTELEHLALFQQLGEAYAGGVCRAPKNLPLSQHAAEKVANAYSNIGGHIAEGRLSLVYMKSLTEASIVEAINHHCDSLNAGASGLVIIDQANRIKRDDSQRFGYTVATEQMLNAIEAVAADQGVPIMLLTQLNRGSDFQERPTMANIKSSSAFEEFAHVVTLLHRDPKLDTAEFIIAKNRAGGTGRIPAYFSGAAHTWSEV